jgi:O-antigen ligase
VGKSETAAAPERIREQKALYLSLAVFCAAYGLLFPLLFSGAPSLIWVAPFFAGIIFLICLYDYRLGVYLLFVFLPLPNIANWKPAFTGLVVILWLGEKILRGPHPREWLKHPLAFVSLFFVLAGIISVTASSNLKEAGLQYARLVGNLLCILVFTDLFQDRSLFFKCLTILLSVAVAEVALAAVEFLRHFAAVWPNLYRCSATFAHPNLFGRYLSTLAMIALALGVLFPPRRWRFWLLAGVFVIGIMLSFSRASLLGLGVGALFFLVNFYRLKYRVLFNLGLGAAVVAANIALLVGVGAQAQHPLQDDINRYTERYLPTVDTGWGTRLYSKLGRDQIWTGSMRMFMDRPLTGVGFGLIIPESPSYMDVDYLTVSGLLEAYQAQGYIEPHGIANAHNMVLAALVDMGVTAIIFLLWSYGVIFYCGYRNLQLPVNPEQRWMIILGLTVVIMDGVIGLVEPANIFGTGISGFLFAVFAATIFAAAKMGIKPPAPAPSTPIAGTAGL